MRMRRNEQGVTCAAKGLIRHARELQSNPGSHTAGSFPQTRLRLDGPGRGPRAPDRKVNFTTASAPAPVDSVFMPSCPHA
jgi:hypothetical protein